VQRGDTSLHYAAWSGHKEVAGMLLRAGAAVDAVNRVRLPPPQHLDEGKCMGHICY
jgi:ankyrin repeat protein